MSQSLELNQRHHVMHLLPEVDCGPKAWTMLKELHAPTSVVATLMLERELSALRLSEGEPVQPSVRTKILEEDFRRRQLRGGDDGSSGYGMQGNRRGRGRGFGGAGRGAKKDDDSNDQQGGTGWGRGAKSGRGGKSGAGGMKASCWYCEKEGHPWFLCYKKPDGWTPQNRHQDGGARRNQKNGTNMVADSSDNNPKSNGGAEKKKERTAGQFFHIGEQGEQRDASAKVGAELHPLDYWVLDTGAAWTMTPRKELIDDVRAAPINEVCSASGHALKVAGAGRAAFKGAYTFLTGRATLLVPEVGSCLEEMGFRTSSCDESRFLKGEGEKLVLFLVYVDDILLFSSSMKEIQKVLQQLMKNFKCKTLGEAAEDEWVEAEEQQHFQSLVGSLLYATVHTRPDISFSVGQLARVVQNPSEEQVDAAEHVVKYLNSHPSIGVQYSASAQVKKKGVEVLKDKGERLGEGKLFLTCFTDAMWASEK
ncbi:unnamed protein product [Closterium sp. NIES-54]